jgi:hypothetical protein
MFMASRFKVLYIFKNNIRDLECDTWIRKMNIC